MASTYISALRWWGRTAGDRPAIVFADRTTTYSQLDAWSSRFARRLAEEGVEPGSSVGLSAANSDTWTAAAIAILKAGAVVVPLNPRLTATEVTQVLSTSQATALILHDGLEKTREGLTSTSPDVAVIPLSTVESLRDGESDSFSIETEEESTLALMFTSGSTGAPKGVTLTNKTLLGLTFEAMLVEPGYHPATNVLLLLPLAFTPGLVWGLLMTTTMGGTLVVEPAPDGERAVELIEEHGVEAVFGVPFLWQAIASAPGFAEADLSTVQTAVVGGAAVPDSLLRAFLSKGVTLRQIYGCSEVGGISTATLMHEAQEHPDSCGIGAVFSDVRVVDPSGEDVGPGVDGEILLRGPGLTPGYFNDPATSSEVLVDGWLHTRDLGRLDADGRLTFVDRIKDLIISGGINISPIEIEQVIAAIPGVREVVVIAADDEKFGETPAAIVTADEGTVTVANIIAACREVLADFKVPRYIVLREHPLPRLPSGKLDKLEIRDAYTEVSKQVEKVR